MTYINNLEWTKRKLPHCNALGLTQFVTFRQKDSLPQSIITQGITNYRQDKLGHLRFLGFLENALDKNLGSCLLRDPDCAWIVEEELKSLHEKLFTLHERVRKIDYI